MRQDKAGSESLHPCPPLSCQRMLHPDTCQPVEWDGVLATSLQVAETARVIVTRMMMTVACVHPTSELPTDSVVCGSRRHYTGSPL